MDYEWNEDLEGFRGSVRSALAAIKTPEIERELEGMDNETRQTGSIARMVREELDRRGWVRISWPQDLGGEGKSPWYHYIVDEELQRAQLPAFQGTANMVGPAVQRFGTPEQKQTYLGGIWSGDITLALGYSEPNAGTDLASLETMAARDGDEWVINGQKLWTSGAHMCSHVWLAARTDPRAPKHRGISMFIVPLDAPGIAVRPIHTMGGTRTNETFFEDVHVPSSAMIGEEGRGWYIAANALDHERVVIGGGVALQEAFKRFLVYLREHRRDVLADRGARRRLAEIALDITVQQALTLTNAAIIAAGNTPTMQASMAKVFNTELRYRMSSTIMDLLGRYGGLSKGSAGAPLDGEFDQSFRGSPVGRFGGGTNEVQRNIIAQRGLGLPR